MARGPKLLADVLRDLMAQRDWSAGQLHDETVRRGGYIVKESTIKSYLRSNATGRVPDARILEALATAFDRDAQDVFYEYPIALARREAEARASAETRLGEGLAREAQQSRERRADTDEGTGSSDATGGQQ